LAWRGACLLTGRRCDPVGYDGFHDWTLLEGRYTLAVLFEYAATLGLIDIAYTDAAGAREDFRENWGTDDLEFLSRYDGLQAIRINALAPMSLGSRSTGRRKRRRLPSRSRCCPTTTWSRLASSPSETG
jgi:hypothetical protein